MGETVRSGLPAAFGRAQRELEQWRQRRRPRARIPEELWREAAKLAGAYGINRIARALRLDYYSLKKHLAAGGGGRRRASGVLSGRPVSRFVEILPAGMATARPEWMIELEDANGVKMRIRLAGGDLPDVCALVGVFRQGRS